MTTRMRRIRALGLVSALLTVAAWCRQSNPIAVGSTEKQVIESLGTPSVVCREPRQFEYYLAFKEDLENCAPKIVRVLYYSRYLRKSVAVGIDAKDRVVCVERYYVVTQ